MNPAAVPFIFTLFLFFSYFRAEGHKRQLCQFELLLTEGYTDDCYTKNNAPRKMLQRKGNT